MYINPRNWEAWLCNFVLPNNQYGLRWFSLKHFGNRSEVGIALILLDKSSISAQGKMDLFIAHSLSPKGSCMREKLGIKSFYLIHLQDGFSHGMMLTVNRQYLLQTYLFSIKDNILFLTTRWNPKFSKINNWHRVIDTPSE